MSLFGGVLDPRTAVGCSIEKFTAECRLPSIEDAKLNSEVISQIYFLALERVVCLAGKDYPVQKDLLLLFVEEADDFLDRLFELCELFGVDDPNIDSVRPLWRWLHCAGVLIPNIKYSLNVAFCRHFDLEMPEPLNICLGLDLFPKRFRVRLGRLRGTQKRLQHKSLYLLNSLFQGFKKGLLPLDLSAYAKNLSKHELSLCHQSGLIPDDLGDEIFRVAEDVLSGLPPLRNESNLLVPSTSGTLESSRGAGGALAQLIWDDLDLFKYEVTFSISPPVLYGSYRIGRDIRWEYGPDQVSCSDIKELELWECERTLAKMHCVSPFGILEPLKIRTITRPNYYSHLGLRGTQKHLLSYLNRFSTFSITGHSGRVEVDEIVAPLHSCPLSRSLGFSSYVSGDYSSATDFLKSDVTKIIWEVIGKKLPWWIYYKGRETLLNTKIIYDDRCFPDLKGSRYARFNGYARLADEVDKTSSQTNGQLMGNILSFPILCLANYIAWHLSLEKYLGRKVGFRDVGDAVRINGDDILFRSNEEFYSIWSDQIAEFGFLKSLGKNHFSREMFQINSQMYRVLPTGFVRIGYCNWGLITGRKKGMSSDDAMIRYDGQEKIESWKSSSERREEVMTQDVSFDCLMDRCPEKFRSRVSKLYQKWFFRRFGDLLSARQKRLLTLPESWGGFSFEGKEPDRFYSGNKPVVRNFFSKRKEFDFKFANENVMARIPRYQGKVIRTRNPKLSVDYVNFPQNEVKEPVLNLGYLPTGRMGYELPDPRGLCASLSVLDL